MIKGGNIDHIVQGKRFYQGYQMLLGLFVKQCNIETESTEEDKPPLSEGTGLGTWSGTFDWEYNTSTIVLFSTNQTEPTYQNYPKPAVINF